jgi:hypothetical protein
MFWDHIMGVPMDYNDKSDKGLIPSIFPGSLMLPVPKAQKVLQECVGENQQETILANDRPLEPTLMDDKRWQKLEARAPIKLVDGRPWSPGVYPALRLLGNTLEVAWERVFIRTSYF